MALIFEMFPQEYLELQKEIKYHPKLIELLQKHNGDEHLDIRVMEVATYCNIIMGNPDGSGGTYTQEDFNKVAKICTERLKGMRERGGVTIVHDMPKELQ